MGCVQAPAPEAVQVERAQDMVFTVSWTISQRLQAAMQRTCSAC